MDYQNNDSNFAAFPTINSFLDEKKIAPEENLLDAMKIHLLLLKIELSHYFPELERESEWSAVIKNPFILKLENLPTKDTSIQENFIDLINDSATKIAFDPEENISSFWIKMAGVYPDLSKIILRLLLPFPTTYRYEAAFSTLVNVKTKSRNRLKTVTHDMRVALSQTVPDIVALSKMKQAHPSH